MFEWEIQNDKGDSVKHPSSAPKANTIEEAVAGALAFVNENKTRQIMYQGQVIITIYADNHSIVHTETQTLPPQ